MVGQYDKIQGLGVGGWGGVAGMHAPPFPDLTYFSVKLVNLKIS